MTPKLRMALCIYGHPRTMEFCAPSVKELIIKPYSPDVFICSSEQGDKIKELYNPVALEIYTETEIYNAIGDRRYRYGRFIPQPGWHQFILQPDQTLNYLYRGQQCGKMLQKYEAIHGIYDVVVTTRFDIKFLHIQPIIMPEENSLYIPSIDAHQWPVDESGLYWHLGYSAHIWWSSSSLAKVILDAYTWSDDYFQETKVWCGEIMAKWFCDKNHVNVHHTDVTHMIIKGDKDHQYSNSVAFGKQLSATHYPEYLSPPLPKEFHIPVPLPTYGGGSNYSPTALYYIVQTFPSHLRRKSKIAQRIDRRKKK